MSFKVNDKVTWVGVRDWERRSFHGEELSVHYGTTYNSYLIRGEKTVLIDTVMQPFAKAFINNLKSEVDLKDIDCIIANHGEPDHSGALPELMREIPDTPIYCSENGIKSLKGHYHKDWNFIGVKTGDRLSLGNMDIIFIEARMLHWPDTIFSYLTGEGILFSNDAFGEHYSSEFMYNDIVDQGELEHESIKYYANILTPFSKMVEQKIKEIVKLNLPLNMVCPSHGVIWRDNPMQIVEKYLKWSGGYVENQVTIIYDTMWNSTRKMAEAISEGIESTDRKINIRVFNASRNDKNDIITEIFKSKAVFMGSPTINKTILESMAGLIEMAAGIGFKNKKAAAFGSYGWGGESVKIINEGLQRAGFEIIDDGLKILWVPDDKGLQECREFGKRIAQVI